MNNYHITHTKMLRVLELLKELTRLNILHLSTIDTLKATGINKDSINHYLNRIDTNNAIKQRLKKYYNNRLAELNHLN